MDNKEEKIEGWKSMAEVMGEYAEFLKRTQEAASKIIPMDYNSSYFDKLNSIKSYYEAFFPEIERHHQRRPTQLWDAYPFNWHMIFTPIEDKAWESLRFKGNLPLYPQFPVDRYIIDFADPFKKIGLELDGEEFHDKERDKIRDEYLHTKGWSIYRISGKEMTRTKYEEWGGEFDPNYFDKYILVSKLDYWLYETGDGIIEALKVVFYGGKIYLPESLHDKFLSLCNGSLFKHSIIKNPNLIFK